MTARVTVQWPNGDQHAPVFITIDPNLIRMHGGAITLHPETARELAEALSAADRNATVSLIESAVGS